MATILFLHGASSSGKSTLAAAIRAQADRPFLHFSIDHLRDSGAWDPTSYADWASARPAFFAGFHQAAASFANAGNDLIFEHILDTVGWHQDLQTLLLGHDLLFVGLHTPLAQLAAREISRGDRSGGSAAADFASIHLGLSYDLTLDGTCPPAENAACVLAVLDQPRRLSRFF